VYKKKQFTKIYKDPADVYEKQIKWQYAIYRDMRYGVASAGRDHIASYIVRVVCVHRLETKTVGT
jgi:hypothetical protein